MRGGGARPAPNRGLIRCRNSPPKLAERSVLPVQGRALTPRRRQPDCWGPTRNGEIIVIVIIIIIIIIIITIIIIPLIPCLLFPGSRIAGGRREAVPGGVLPLPLRRRRRGRAGRRRRRRRRQREQRDQPVQPGGGAVPGRGVARLRRRRRGVRRGGLRRRAAVPARGDALCARACYGAPCAAGEYPLQCTPASPGGCVACDANASSICAAYNSPAPAPPDGALAAGARHRRRGCVGRALMNPSIPAMADTALAETAPQMAPRAGDYDCNILSTKVKSELSLHTQMIRNPRIWDVAKLRGCMDFPPTRRVSRKFLTAMCAVKIASRVDRRMPSRAKRPHFCLLPVLGRFGRHPGLSRCAVAP